MADTPNYEAEIESLQAENLALQALIMGLLNSLAVIGNAKLAQGAFVYADQALETVAMAMGSRVPNMRLPMALKVLEELQAMLHVPEEDAGK
jgi:hypothetical protein